MDNVLFYQPPSASRSQRLPFPGTVTAPHLPRESIASAPARLTITTVDIRPLETSDLRSGTEKHASTVPRNPPNYDGDGDHSDDDDLPDLEELLFGTRQKILPTRADLSGDDYNGFIDIDDLPSDMEVKGASCTGPESGGMVLDMVDNGTRSGSPVGSSDSTSGSSRDPIILGDSEDESAGESEIHYGNPNSDLTDKSDSSSSHIADRNMADGEGFDSGTTYISDRPVNDNDSGLVDGARVQLAADLSMSASPGHDSVTLQVYPVRASTELTEGSRSFPDLDVSKEAEDEGIDVFADDEADADTCSMRISGSPAISPESLAPESDNAPSELQGSQHDPIQSPQRDLGMVSLEQSDSNNGSRPSNCRRRDDTKKVRRERVLTQAPTAPARSTSPVSAVPESGDECPQPVAQLVAPSKKRGICDTDQEMVDVGGTDDSNDEDYSETSDAVASKIRDSRSRKRVKRARDRDPSSVETLPNHSLNLSYQDCTTAATSSHSMQESEEISIRGFLTLKTIGSKVVYSLTFSQELSPEVVGASRSQGTPRSVSEPSPVQELAVGGPSRTRYSTEEDELLLQLKGEGLSWDEISEHFPERSKGTLQVHYSTKLKPRSEKSKNRRKRWRSG